MNFDQAFELLMGHEGGYVNHPSDPGGETNHGITLAVARSNGYTGDMRDLPRQVAKDIAHKLYWQTVKCDILPDALRYATFDAAYNSGPSAAIKWLQMALGQTPDGVIGIKTLAALDNCNADLVLIRMLGNRLDFLANLKTFPTFGRGWTRRISNIMKETK